MDERLQWLIMERDLEMMTRRIQDTEMKKAWQKARQKAQKIKMENQKQDLINGVTAMEKQEEKDDLHHINKKQMMENQDRINGRKSMSEMEKQEMKQIMETEKNQQRRLLPLMRLLSRHPDRLWAPRSSIGRCIALHCHPILSLVILLYHGHLRKKRHHGVLLLLIMICSGIPNIFLSCCLSPNLVNYLLLCFCTLVWLVIS